MDNTLSLVKELSKQIISVIEKQETAKPPFTFTPIEKLNLSTRALNCLARNNVNYVENFVWLTKEDIMKMRNMGKSTFNEINEEIKKIGLRGWN